MQLYLQNHHSIPDKHIALINWSKVVRKSGHMVIPCLKLKKYTTLRLKVSLNTCIYKTNDTILRLGAYTKYIMGSFLYLLIFLETLYDSGLPTVLHLITTMQHNSLTSL